MKKLRSKIILGVFFTVTAVFAMTVLIVGLIFNYQESRDADRITNIIVKYKGDIPDRGHMEMLDDKERFLLESFGEEFPFRIRYFTVSFDKSGESLCDLTHIAAIDEDKAEEMTETVLGRRGKLGYIDKFRYRISEDGSFIAFLDHSSDLNAIRDIMLAITAVSSFFIITITVVFWFFSKRIVRPFEENMKMQKQFITDASHELKTPLAIISANAEVLAYKEGENEWINNITCQVARTSELVNELLTLNRLEEVEEITDIELVDLTEKAISAAETFEAVFNGKDAKLQRDIQENIVINGSPAQLERLISVLVENASKYVSKGGEARISLRKDQRHTYLSVFNTCKIDENTDYSHLFDRFYRPDSSRDSKTGGHGIGLSIAKRIVTLHNGSIEAVPSENGLTFNIKLSNRLKPKKKNS